MAVLISTCSQKHLLQMPIKLCMAVTLMVVDGVNAKMGVIRHAAVARSRLHVVALASAVGIAKTMEKVANTA